MDRTSEFDLLTKNRKRRPRLYSPFDDVTSLRTKINKVKNYLLKYGHGYLDTYGCLVGESRMDEEQRDKFDLDIEEFIKTCDKKLELLRSEIRLGTSSTQVMQHRESVLEIISKTRSDFVNLYTQLRSTRMKRNFEKQKYDRVECKSGRLSPSRELEVVAKNETVDMNFLSSLLGEDEIKASHATRATPSSISFDDCQQHSLIAAEHHTPISPEEVQVLALENSRIHEELITLDDEIKLIGKKVVQISKLQELFTEKVMEQTTELNNVHEAAIKSTENVREGNDMIRDAIMKNASTRVFILFYIVTLGFTILFLDWYNP